MEATSVPQTHERVLILDDEPSQLKTLTAILEEEGFRVLACSRAAEALKALAQGDVAVAVVDLRLPDLGTEDLLNALVAWSDRVPIIINTAFASYDSARDAVNLGAFAYVEKAGNPADLVRHVHRAFQSRLRRYAEKLEQAVHARTRELQSVNATLLKSEERLALAASGTRIGMYEWNVATGEILWTEQVARLLGLRTTTTTTTTTTFSQQYHYHDWAECVHPDDLPREEAALQRCMTERVPYEAEYRVVWPDGSVHWIADRGIFQYGSDSRSTRMLGVVMDVTERRRAEEALRESEDRFRQMANSLPQLVWTCQPDGPCDFLSQQWIEYTGIPAGSQLGYGWLEQLHPDDRERTVAAWSAAVAAGTDFQVEFRIRGRDGVYRWFDTRAASLHDAAGRVVKWFGSNTDITERKQAEQKVLDYQRQLKALASELTMAEERLRRDVAVHVHDDISQTLAMSKVQVEALREAVSDDPLRAALTGIIGSLEQTLRDARDLTAQLSYPTLTVLGLEKAVEKWLFEEVARCGLETVFDHDLEDKPLDDDVRAVLFRSVRELLTNVVKHAHAARVVVSMQRRANQVVTVIEDDGVGCDPEEMMTGSRGFGILSIRESLERLGGELHIESQRAAGCKVTVKGPLKVESPLKSEVNAR